jgi:hypothetical protein
MKALIVVLLFMISAHSWSDESVLNAPTPAGEERVIYRYKEYEKFDFEDLIIEGETGNPGDLSIAPRYQRRFENKLPYRKNFNAEIRKGIERVR